MKILLILWMYYALPISSAGEDRQYLNSIVSLVELDYVDHCAERASATWEELTGSVKGFSKKMERDKAYGLLAQNIRDEVKSAYTEQALWEHDDILRRKVKLLLQPGDVMIGTDQWIRLVTFADTAQHKLRFATNYDCGASVNCSLREFQVSFARQSEEETLLRMKKSWEQNLPDMHEYYELILPLLRNASKDYKTVEEYWDSLVEYEGAMLKARELWDHVKPLYTKLHKYIALRMKGIDAVGKPLPVHLLRSLNGDDWSGIIENLLPKHPAIYQKLHANLQLKELGGINAFKVAAQLIHYLRLGEIKEEVWSESIFNSTCPSTLVDWCKPNKVRIATCKDISIGNYIEAHETAAMIIYKQNTAQYSNNTYILREAPRYSAIYEAIAGFLSLLALNPHAIERNGLFPIDIFNYNANHHRTILQMIQALRDLPKLNYYLAADEWRLNVLKGTIIPSNAAKSWSEYRKDFSLLDTSESDLLSDPYVVFNKPFIGKFMGLILKYQIYQSFAEELISDESDLLEHVAISSDRLSDTMLQGYSVKWPELVSDLLAKKENGLEFTGLTDYYRLLDEYLDSQLEPIEGAEIIDDYIDPVIEESDKNSEDTDYIDLNNKVDESESEPPMANNIDTGDESNYKFTETSTVAVLEIKKPIETGDHTNDAQVNEASYNVYWWIGIGVALAVVVILIAVIARKRHNHRKQLERQRRDNSRA
ncbi:hypothetical protein ACJJTC_019861 [Scirpophaga incertulas]